MNLMGTKNGRKQHTAELKANLVFGAWHRTGVILHLFHETRHCEYRFARRAACHWSDSRPAAWTFERDLPRTV